MRITPEIARLRMQLDLAPEDKAALLALIRAEERAGVLADAEAMPTDTSRDAAYVEGVFRRHRRGLPDMHPVTARVIQWARVCTARSNAKYHAPSQLGPVLKRQLEIASATWLNSYVYTPLSRLDLARNVAWKNPYSPTLATFYGDLSRGRPIDLLRLDASERAGLYGLLSDAATIHPGLSALVFDPEAQTIRLVYGFYFRFRSDAADAALLRADERIGEMLLRGWQYVPPIILASEVDQDAPP